MADENELDRLAGLRPDGAEAYTELARLRSAADPERDARREAYRETERRRAARALDRYIETINGPFGEPITAAGERFVEAVGDYVLSTIKEHWQGLIDRYDQAFRDHVEQSLQQKSDYGVPRCRKPIAGTPMLCDRPAGHGLPACGSVPPYSEDTDNTPKSHYGATEHECWIKDDACLIKGHPEPCRHPNHPYFPDDCMFPNNVVSNETPHNADSVATYGPDES